MVTADASAAAGGEQRSAEITMVGYDGEDNETSTVTIPVTLAVGNVWFDNEPGGKTILLPLAGRP